MPVPSVRLNRSFTQPNNKGAVGSNIFLYETCCRLTCQLKVKLGIQLYVLQEKLKDEIYVL